MPRAAITQGWLARLPPHWRNGETLRFRSWFLLPPGLAVLALAAGRALSTLSFLGRAIGTDAVVARLERRVNRRPSDLIDGSAYVAVFAFTTAQGRRREVVGSIGGDPLAWRSGETLRLLHDPRDPSVASPANPASLWLWEALWGFAGLLLAGTALAMRALAPPVDREAGRG